MKRFALIVEGSECPGEDALPGAKADCEAYGSWLRSNLGGDWRQNEIVCLHTPSVDEVKKALQAAGKVDYGVVTFSGHGYHSQELDQTKVCLRQGRMGVRELLPNAERCTVVVDACRKVMREVFTESYQLSVAEVRKYAEFARTRNFRQEFETLVEKAEKGFVFLYSCNLDEAAGESRRGGYFSRALVEAGKAFGDRNTDGSKGYPMNLAFNAAAVTTTGYNPAQHPQFEPGRRLVHFPFAV